MNKPATLALAFLFLIHSTKSFSSTSLTPSDGEDVRTQASTPALAPAGLSIERHLTRVGAAAGHSFDMLSLNADHTSIDVGSSNPTVGTERRYIGAEGVGELINDYQSGIRHVQEIENTILEMRQGNAIDLEKLAAWKDKWYYVYDIIHKLSWGTNYVLAACGSASLITESNSGLKIVILIMGALLAISQVTAILAQKTKEQSAEIREQVKEIINEEKRTVSAKKDELVRRGVIIDSIDNVVIEPQIAGSPV